MKAGARWATLGVAVGLGLAGCAEEGGSGLPTPLPAPPPAPEPAPPEPPPPPPPPEPPATPTGLMVSEITETSITWTWNAAESATSYVVQASLDEVFDATDTVLFGGAPFTTDTSYTATDLEPETAVYVRVAAAAGTMEAPLVSAFTTHRTGRTLAAPPPPEPPPALTHTWIGFADPLRAQLLAGGRIRVSVTAKGEPLDGPLRLRLDHALPGGTLVVPAEVLVERHGHGMFEISRPPAAGVEAASSYGIALDDPEDGLPPGVALSGNRSSLRIALLAAKGATDCSVLHLSASRERFDRRGGFSSARLLVEGPEHVAVRFLEPYWEDRFEQWDEPPELPIRLSQVADVPLIFPDTLSYRDAGGGGHSQRVSLAWYGDLELEAVAPGCAPSRLRCPVETILTQGCRGWHRERRLGRALGAGLESGLFTSSQVP